MTNNTGKNDRKPCHLRTLIGADEAIARMHRAVGECEDGRDGFDESADSVGQRLSDLGLINSTVFFKAKLKLRGSSTHGKIRRARCTPCDGPPRRPRRAATLARVRTQPVPGRYRCS